MKAERNYPRYTVTAKAEAAILRATPGSMTQKLQPQRDRRKTAAWWT